VQRPHRVESRPQQLARLIREEIEAGRLRDGDTLPATRDLADQWGTSVFTVTQAMKLLARDGLVESQPGSKRIIRAPWQRHRRELRLPQPHVLLIGGYAGSGKTELGRTLIRETGWAMIDKDTITRPIVELTLEVLGVSPHDRESETYLTIVRPREYEALLAATVEQVECGNSVIVTAPHIREFSDMAWISRTTSRLSALGADVTLVWVYCDADTMHTYLRHRGAARDAWKLGHWDEYLASIDVGFRPHAPHVLIDNSSGARPLQEQARELVNLVLKREG